MSEDQVGPKEHSNNSSGYNANSNDPLYVELGFFGKLYWKCCKKKQDTVGYRVIKVFNRIYPPVPNDNTIKNTKYNILTFFPKFFFNQFKYFFNFYYLCLCLSQFYEPLKIGFLFTYIGPLAFVLFLSMFNEIVDELTKFVRDFEVNGEKYTVLVSGIKSTKKAGDLLVGDILYLEEGRRAPADILILSTSDENDKCFVRTDQIDGETDLKLRYT